MAYDTKKLDYNSFTQSIIDLVRENWFRVVSIDLETKILEGDDFLTGERLLGIGVSRRVGYKIESEIFTLKDDSDEAEIELMNEAAKYMNVVKPLVLLGYNISGYDFPLLNLKLKWYDDYNKKLGKVNAFPKEYWALKDACTRAYILDLMHPLRFAIAEHDKAPAKYKSLQSAVNHEMFRHLDLMRVKELAQGTTSADKGRTIYELWKSKNPNFQKYLEGDVHDVLVLAEEIFGIKTNP
ncbi:Uncharacterised protein [Candidatus Gugararchaeum adminiculabundum]|nr:Uncharacterised protein [Candidatus Gugararchaeum adminiculabundum]